MKITKMEEEAQQNMNYYNERRSNILNKYPHLASASRQPLKARTNFASSVLYSGNAKGSSSSSSSEAEPTLNSNEGHSSPSSEDRVERRERDSFRTTSPAQSQGSQGHNDSFQEIKKSPSGREEDLRIESKNQVLMFNAMHAIFSGTSHDIHSNMKVIELH